MTSNPKPENQFIESSFFSLGTLNYIKICNCSNQELLHLVVKKVHEIDDRMSAFKHNSDISRLNSNSGKGFVDIDEETFKLLERSKEISRMSSGAFDITIRPLVELWGIGKKNNFIPKEEDIHKVKKLVNYRDLLLEQRCHRAALKYPGQAVDLGGIAKGYAADEVKRILLENQVESALINLGGNILTIGNRPDGKPWQVGIQNPLEPTGKSLGILSSSDEAIVTSGSNERFFIKEGIRYHHILDPRTGKPANTSLLSVTAVSACSMDADALTTSLFILGLCKTSQVLLERLKAKAVFVTEKLEILVTPNLRHTLL